MAAKALTITSVPGSTSTASGYTIQLVRDHGGLPTIPHTTNSSTLQTSPTNFTYDAASVGGAAVADTGHYHVYVDGSYFGYAASGVTSVTLPDDPTVEDETHVVSVELVNNDHSSLDPIVRDEISVTSP